MFNFGLNTLLGFTSYCSCCIDRSSEQILREIQKLKHIIGDLTVELKKASTSCCEKEGREHEKSSAKQAD